MLTALLAHVTQAHSLAILASAVVLAAFLSRAHKVASSIPGRIPLVREKPTATHFSLWTRLAFHLNCSSLYNDIYHKFSKIGKAVTVPTLGMRDEIFLPHSSLPWALSQSSRVLGMWEAFTDVFLLQHSLGDDKYMIDTWPHLLSRQILTHELDDHLMSIHEEIKVAIDTHMGQDTENWKTLNLLETVRMIITQTGCRFTVGLPLCRDKTYLDTIMSTVDSIVANAAATGFFPDSIRSFVGRIICWPTHRKIAHLSTLLDDEFKGRIYDIKTNNPDEKVDLIQKMMRYAQKHRPEELSTHQMTRRVCMSSLAFIYLASFTTTNIFINLIASDKTYNTVSALRDEATKFLTKYPNPRELWTRDNSKKMVKADSLMKETLRLNSVPTRAIVRKVMVDGLVTDAGTPLPKGSLVSFVSQPMHTDPDRFAGPLQFDPFRFTHLRANEGASKDRDATPGEAGGEAFDPNSFLSTADLLVFGRGKNSCPGRLLMDFQLKMVLYYLVLHYDLKFPDEYHDQPPSHSWVLEFMFPASRTKFQVKRRKPTDLWHDAEY